MHLILLAHFIPPTTPNGITHSCLTVFLHSIGPLHAPNKEKLCLGYNTSENRQWLLNSKILFWKQNLFVHLQPEHITLFCIICVHQEHLCGLCCVRQPFQIRVFFFEIYNLISQDPSMDDLNHYRRATTDCNSAQFTMGLNKPSYFSRGDTTRNSHSSFKSSFRICVKLCFSTISRNVIGNKCQEVRWGGDLALSLVWFGKQASLLFFLPTA